jgi:hypothetical protein
VWSFWPVHLGQLKANRLTASSTNFHAVGCFFSGMKSLRRTEQTETKVLLWWRGDSDISLMWQVQANRVVSSEASVSDMTSNWQVQANRGASNEASRLRGVGVRPCKEPRCSAILLTSVMPLHTDSIFEFGPFSVSVSDFHMAQDYRWAQRIAERRYRPCHPVFVSVGLVTSGTCRQALIQEM